MQPWKVERHSQIMNATHAVLPRELRADHIYCKCVAAIEVESEAEVCQFDHFSGTVNMCLIFTTLSPKPVNTITEIYPEHIKGIVTIFLNRSLFSISVFHLQFNAVNPFSPMKKLNVLLCFCSTKSTAGLRRHCMLYKLFSVLFMSQE